MYNRRYKRSAIYVGLEDEGLKVKGNVMTGSKTSFHKISYLTTKVCIYICIHKNIY